MAKSRKKSHFPPYYLRFWANISDFRYGFWELFVSLSPYLQSILVLRFLRNIVLRYA